LKREKGRKRYVRANTGDWRKKARATRGKRIICHKKNKGGECPSKKNQKKKKGKRCERQAIERKTKNSG